jgi:hypothetical protein
MIGLRWKPCHALCMAFIVIQIQDPEAEPYWTLLDATGGGDLRDAHRFATKQQAEEVADLMNGVEADQPDKQ